MEGKANLAVALRALPTLGLSAGDAQWHVSWGVDREEVPDLKAVASRSVPFVLRPHFPGGLVDLAAPRVCFARGTPSFREPVERARMPGQLPTRQHLNRREG